MCFNQIVSSGQYHLTSNLNLFLSPQVKHFHRLRIKRKSVGCHYCKPTPYAFSGENSCSNASQNEGKLVIILDTNKLVIIFDTLTNSVKSRSFQNRYRARISCSPFTAANSNVDSLPSSESCILNV